jgi:uncharacterized protein YciI
MPTFVLMCVDHPGGLDRRLAAREAHLAYARENLSMVKLAGPLMDEAGQMAGSMFIMDAQDQAAVEAFTAADPYSLAGVFERVEIRPWKITVGALA